MKFYKKTNRTFIFLFFILSISIFYSEQDEPSCQHVRFFLKKKAQSKKGVQSNHNKIYEATYQLKIACKKKYKNLIEENPCYQHRRNTVFFIDCDDDAHHWTLYKPSFIPYKAFVTLAKKIYRQHGLLVTCNKDELIQIASTDASLDNYYMTLDELESYKKKSDEKFASKKTGDIKKYLFWYLQVPTTGAIKNSKFDIDDQYKPLAWHYLLWDLAPKKGKGAHVAMIDTGVSAFNIQEQEFSSLYKKNINITIPDDLLNYGYNLISKNGLDPIRQIVINFGNFCDHELFDSKKLMEDLPEMIIDFIKNKNSLQIEQYFAKNAKKEYLKEGSCSLNEKGKEVLKGLLYGKYGIAPSETNSFFHLVNLQDPYNQQVLLETLPAPKVIGNKNPFAAGHGTFTQGIVNGKLYNNLGIHGLAPQAHVTMIKAFKDNGTTNKTTLNAALARAKTLKNSIVSMSLKITDSVDKIADAPLKDLIDSIDYVVAASGNDGKNSKLKNKEAYPARFDSVAFDVGAFEYNDGKYPVCAFTQKELHIGPKFVAPGFNLFSAGLTPDQSADSMYLFMSGTSIAVPVITGFLALVLAEFQDDFTREQLLKVIYKFSIKLNNDENWNKYIKIGTPDMRSCLLCLHVLKSLKNKLDTKYIFDQNFNNLVQAIFSINYYVPLTYEKILKRSLIENFSEYKEKIESIEQQISINFFTPDSNTISDCIDFITELILSAMNQDHKNNYKFDFKKHPDFLDSLKIILATKNLNLFASISTSAQNRIKTALAPRKKLYAQEI